MVQQFENRSEAGKLLAEKLFHLSHFDPIIMALPRGGVPIAYEVSQKLKTQMDVVLVKKIHAPGSPEFAIGAVAEDEKPMLQEDYIKRENLDREKIENIIKKRIAENKKRQRLYREKMSALSLVGRTVIIVDDGLATGSSMLAAVRWIKSQKAKRVIVAVPISSTYGANILKIYADDFISLITADNMMAVGMWYNDFNQISDEEVLQYLELRPLEKEKANDDQGTRKTIVEEAVLYAKPFLQTKDLKMKMIADMAKNKIVMLGESTHGTQEYYQMRREISEILIKDHGFSFIAVEGDWPSCHRLCDYLYSRNGDEAKKMVHNSFHRWPTWMWSNTEIPPLIEWMKTNHMGGFYGLDVYSLFESLEEIKKYLNKIDPDLAEEIEQNYQCFDSFKANEMKYAESLLKLPAGCKDEVVTNLRELLRIKLRNTKLNRRELFDLKQNAKVIRDAENYYRTMLSGGAESWNVRDTHMMDTLENLLHLHGEDSKAIVWAHNTHVGDYHATDMLSEGYVNLGGLAREKFGPDNVYLLGFGTHHGTVKAGKAWGRDGEDMELPDARATSYEDHFHKVCGALNCSQFFLPLNKLHRGSALFKRFGHRAVGVVYDPIREGHGQNYVPTKLAERYDGFIFIDETHALQSLDSTFVYGDVPETWPAGI
jgi:erythromycin esterase